MWRVRKKGKKNNNKALYKHDKLNRAGTSDSVCVSECMSNVQKMEKSNKKMNVLKMEKQFVGTIILHDKTFKIEF